MVDLFYGAGGWGQINDPAEAVRLSDDDDVALFTTPDNGTGILARLGFERFIGFGAMTTLSVFRRDALPRFFVWWEPSGADVAETFYVNDLAALITILKDMAGIPLLCVLSDLAYLYEDVAEEWLRRAEKLAGK